MTSTPSRNGGSEVRVFIRLELISEGEAEIDREPALFLFAFPQFPLLLPRLLFDLFQVDFRFEPPKYAESRSAMFCA